jgi:folate-binding protein YgfZ
MTPGEQALAVRRGAGLFRLGDRGLLAVEGEDRSRWLGGMVSNDVVSLSPGLERSGCYALLLTPKAGIVADLHVLLRPDAFWLESARAAIGPVRERLERYVVADDVRLGDRSAGFDRLALEGPRARDLLGRAAGEVPPLAPDACAELCVAGVDAVVAAFGWSGEDALQLFAPAGAGEALADAIQAAAPAGELVLASEGALEVLRVEAGIPRLGAELHEDILPDEARLARAISSTKGCYTGQEIVARIRSRGQVNHLLVGLAFPDDAPAAPGTILEADGKRVGEVTSSCVSPAAGAIGLGYVRRAQAEPGTALRAGDHAARVCDLPFAGPGAGSGRSR